MKVLRIGEEAKVIMVFICLWILVGLLVWALRMSSSDNHQDKSSFNHLAQGESLAK